MIVFKNIEAKIKKINLHTKEDVISYYPTRYIEVKNINLKDLTKDQDVAISARIYSHPFLKKIKTLNLMEFSIFYNGQIVKTVIFNREFLKNKIIPNEEIIVFGKYSVKTKKIVISNLEFVNINLKMIPVYPLTEGVTNKQISFLVEENLKKYEFEEIIPEYFCRKYKLISKKEALNLIHFPKNYDDIKQARRRLKYEECFIFFLKLLALKKDNVVVKKQLYLKDRKIIDNFILKLPFVLTDSQKEAINDILNDMDSELPMNRLLQGDVGSGKTVVAATAMLHALSSNYQSVLMSPTEILAKQHFLTLQKMFPEINIVLLTSSIKNKKNVLEEIAKGDAKIIVGTHAVFQKDVNYHNLSLVITDEQHRFGVNQRKELRDKALYPDILFLSATPIPRSLFLTIFGDVDVSNIFSVPTGRKKIITKIVKKKDEDIIIDKIKKELLKKHQVYIVAPLIEESEKVDLENISNLLEVFKNKLPDFKIKIIHGKMKDSEKEIIMNEFNNHEFSILIATTVIEVGIDVKNATLMVIYEASRFGIATLHQLRGRVGRSSYQSYCLLISDEITERLNIIKKSTDGFFLAEEDLRLRGPGDFFGERQSGEMPFKVTNLLKDEVIINIAKQDVVDLLSSNEIEKYKFLKKIYYETLKININA